MEEATNISISSQKAGRVRGNRGCQVKLGERHANRAREKYTEAREIGKRESMYHDVNWATMTECFRIDLNILFQLL